MSGGCGKRWVALDELFRDTPPDYVMIAGLVPAVIARPSGVKTK
jgi:hypothetical protein